MVGQGKLSRESDLFKYATVAARECRGIGNKYRDTVKVSQNFVCICFLLLVDKQLVWLEQEVYK